MKGKTENPQGQLLRDRHGRFALGQSWQAGARRGLEGKVPQLVRGNHAPESAHQGGNLQGQRRIFQEPAQVLQSEWHALQEMRLAFIKTAKTVRAERLHDAYVNKRIIMMQELVAANLDEIRQPLQIVVEQVLAQRRRQIGLGVIKQGSDVILQRSLAAALVVEKERLALAQHHIARLKVAIKKGIARRAEQKAGQPSKVDLQRLLAERHVSQLEKVILEVVQVPRDRQAIESGARITDAVIQVAPGFNLKPRQRLHHFAVDIDHRRRDLIRPAVLREKVKQGGVAQVFFQISAGIQVFSVDFRHRQPVAPKVAREFEEGDVFSAHVVDHANGARSQCAQAQDVPPGSAKLALERLHLFHRAVEVPLKQRFENIHGV